MTFKACAVVPIYNHQNEIGATVAALIAHGLTVWVVDDGSNLPTQAVLARLVELYGAQLQLLRLPHNRGKGGAVMAGLRAAHAAGFSHALQIDADGQHDAADVPLFLELGRTHPSAVILGRPVYDESVPKGRLYGRYLTHVWVWIETLSLEIRDSMCGFRLYPLPAVCALIERRVLPERMDFDIEILVRLHWTGMNVLTVPTRVTYAADGVSHFNLWWDNLRISQAHVRLVCGMLLRLPVLLMRKLPGMRSRLSHQGSPRANSSAWWRVSERGSRLGMKLLALSCKWLGRGFTRFCLHPVVVYFWLTGARARSESFRYFNQLNQSRPRHDQAAENDVGFKPEEFKSAEDPLKPGWRTAYRHLFAFADSGLDKLAAWSGQLKLHDIDFPRQAEFDALIASKQGALIVGSHLGNLEMMRALAVRGSLARITAVVYTEHARRFNSVLAGAHREFASRVLQVSNMGPATAMLMHERIEAGELLVIVGDRVPVGVSTRITDVEFMGRPAPFAHGPFTLAHALGCPVYLFFALKQAGRYQIHFEHFADRIMLPRTDRVAHLNVYIQRYAQRLEYYCRLAPLQWFNFFDFWQRPQGVSRGRK
jgi:predicted LPLAT superfamily acyltransferase